MILIFKRVLARGLNTSLTVDESVSAFPEILPEQIVNISSNEIRKKTKSSTKKKKLQAIILIKILYHYHKQ